MKKQKNTVFFLPPAQKFTLLYKKVDGQVTSHVISAPIESKEDEFTAYSFGRGVRTFKKSGILSLK